MSDMKKEKKDIRKNYIYLTEEEQLEGKSEDCDFNKDELQKQVDMSRELIKNLLAKEKEKMKKKGK